MRLRNMSTYATLLTGVLLLVGMLLVDFVVSAFWHHHALRERRARMRDVLEYAALHLERAPWTRFGGGAFAPLASLPEDAAFCLYLLTKKGTILDATCPAPPVPEDKTALTDILAALVPERAAHLSRSLHLGGRGGERRLLVTENPAFPTVTAQVLRAQQYALFYILLNALVLSILAFFRHLRRIQRPLDNLVATADSLHALDAHPFSEVQDLGELHRLSFSLNRMLRRLEQDRLELQQAAAELADKNRQILAQQREMVRAEKLAATGRLAAGLAHEIGNPLGVVQGYLELLGMPDCGEQERREYTAHALEETRRMHRLVTMLLQAARHRPEQAQAAERLDLRGFLAEFVESMRPQSLFRDIELRLEATEDDARIDAPPDALRQVLLNAFLNAADAIHAARQGRGLVVLGLQRVELEGRECLEVSVADNGCGLAPEHAEKIFDHFFTTKEPGAGTGLGLSVSLALVENMGGGMWAENREEGGMTLHILLPPAGHTETEA